VEVDEPTSVNTLVDNRGLRVEFVCT